MYCQPHDRDVNTEILPYIPYQHKALQNCVKNPPSLEWDWDKCYKQFIDSKNYKLEDQKEYCEKLEFCDLLDGDAKSQL